MALFTLFDEENAASPEGLAYRENFLTVDEELDLVDWIDSHAWNTEYSRRRQFYGRSYRNPSVESEIPLYFAELALRLVEEGLVTCAPDHVLINEYRPGQGIAAHLDEMPRPDSQVVTISLLDSYPMEFARIGTDEKFEQWLARRSVAVMSGASRVDWTHEILKRKADIVQGGGRRMRGRRISVTYRTMLFEPNSGEYPHS
jgi:alkylated DNA repair dioxygenase AlkB